MAQTMKAAVWHAKKDIRVEEVPVPAAPGPDEVQVEVEVHFVNVSNPSP
jgi:(R,R)-butanediol dehydrogenase/meso-butanediol dehydrogenase/diacetyl reductase